jgi:hypothetical protein
VKQRKKRELVSDCWKAHKSSPSAIGLYDRPFDIHVAWDDMPGTDIKKGDLFAISTQGFCVKTTQDLSQASLKAGDVAKNVLVATISSLTPDEFGIADHLAMIQAAKVVAHV